jgi:hypothetical protein
MSQSLCAEASHVRRHRRGCQQAAWSLLSMTKRLNQQRITQADLAEYLAKRDDFALELAVYNAAVKLGLATRHGGTYEDSVTKKTRQYDIRVEVDNGKHRIALAIECKALHESYPLLVSRVPRSKEESFHQVLYSRNPDGRGWPPKLFDQHKVFCAEGDCSIYKAGEPVGKSMAQVGRSSDKGGSSGRGEIISGDSEVFDKWSQAFSSADDLIAASWLAAEEHGVAEFFSFVLPVLVVPDETLWAADYSEEGSAVGDPHLVAEATYFVGREYFSSFGPYTLSHLHICTRRTVSELLSQVADRGPFWRRVFQEGALPDPVEGT